MLVLSRRPTQQINFPNLGIVLTVVRIQGNTVRLGIEAPQNIRVVRGELSRDSWEPPSLEDTSPSVSVAVDPHRVRNCLNTAVLALQVASRRAQTDPSESECMISKALCELDQINQSLAEGPLVESVTLDRWK